MDRVLLVWNPVSTEVNAETIGTVLVRLSERHDTVAMHTLEANDGVRLGELAVSERFDAVFVLGGDGTANEVVNGVGDRLPVGVLPAGGTSVLPRVLGIPRDLEAAIDHLTGALERRTTRTVSLGTLNDRRFTFAAGIGVDAEIVRRIDERGRGGENAEEAARPGDLWFVKEAIGVLVDGEYAAPSMRVEANGREYPAATVFVANCSPWSFAGPIELDVAPEATFEGGIDLVIVESIEAQKALGRLRSLFLKSDPDDAVEGVTRLHDLDRATIRCDRPTPAQVDGELLGEFDEIELGVVRDAARLLV